MDLKTINKIEKSHYVPREDAGNGTLLKGTVFYSMDKENWTKAGTFQWDKDNEVKIFGFKDAPTARYIKLNITEGVGGYGSGREIYVFKVPGTESYLPGDINNDGKIDRKRPYLLHQLHGLRKGIPTSRAISAMGTSTGTALLTLMTSPSWPPSWKMTRPAAGGCRPG